MSDRTATLKHMLSGPIWDGNLISKSDRDALVEAGYVDRVMGYNFLTTAGVALCITLGLLKP
jgi:hypothetical protein